ncbi:hypothetical protein HBI56_173410 [Parastagonospora nodorum]|uniref:AB hydrolase-1 domain-containing protein n=1 Tax=Phaeosphaeria nodorum (strain SN15 / ATCC MYA-4574 / FGSC 10173) TaxID=321614 RepID=A0A7U2F217_PHANO|nr:hypothetical protein HBH56_222230 [Parastagonospora nodorum]QRC97223.1 hypothetical protein JI435_139050 [Parastagonospora nodorum SN15]KAH3924157.1 hypothetical protein HBH54_199530 [Parastagonospora nodorum]KAH3944602.1 hypothetical protein HBH53_155890 [Parastagonospora nodorum]KAH3963461.1 hypothetical protein HBH51_168820 [Parastagonospora nodorum]
MAATRPFIVIVPGGAQNPAHYGYLSHLLLLAGYPVYSALLPSVGTEGKVTIDDDAAYIRDRMLLPILDYEEHDVILLMHSYGGIPGSAAANGLSKTERSAQGKNTSVIGQIYFAAILAKGGDGGNLLDPLGGQYPPHITPDPLLNVLRCTDRIRPLYHDVPADLAEALAVSAMVQGKTSFESPCPRATWDSDHFKGRVAFVRTLKDASIPVDVQQMMIDGTGVEWIVKDIESGHSPQGSQPEKLTSIVVELTKAFQEL